MIGKGWSKIQIVRALVNYIWSNHIICISVNRYGCRVAVNFTHVLRLTCSCEVRCACTQMCVSEALVFHFLQWVGKRWPGAKRPANCYTDISTLRDILTGAAVSDVLIPFMNCSQENKWKFVFCGAQGEKNERRQSHFSSLVSGIALISDMCRTWPPCKSTYCGLDVWIYQRLLGCRWPVGKF